MGCGCVALVVAVLAAIGFFLYASTDPGPPVDAALVLAALAGIIGGARARGVRPAGPAGS